MRILVVEDSMEIALGLETALRRENYQVDLAHNGLDGEELALTQSYGIIILDWMLPKKSGVEVCQSLRKLGISTPILMLTAKDTVGDRVEGLDSGADDYLVKPFALEELFARLRSLRRRESSDRSQVITIGSLEIDPAHKTVKRNGERVALTQREFELLEALARNRERVLTREVILSRVWNNDEALPNTVNFHMASLRKKVDPDGELIQTVHGMGYSLRLP